MRKKVLVLDNDPDILFVMQEILDYEGFAVDTHQGNEDVMLFIEESKPDLLIIDYTLNGLNGGEICRKVKSASTTCHLPVIIFSAYPKLLQSLRYYRCNAFIAKPFDLSVLIDKVAELVSY